MTEVLELKKEDKVLEIGTGSGYQAAILAEIASKVISVERIPTLLDNAKGLLNGYSNLTLVLGDGSLGYEKEAPYDAIIVTAAANHVPKHLIAQLKEGGRLVMPLERNFSQKLYRITKSRGKISEEYICDVRFVPLV